MEKEKQFNIILSKGRELPCMWEEGGAYTKKGSAVVIANKFGDAKVPLVVSTRGNLACRQHALIPIRKDDVIIEVEQYLSIHSIAAYRIDEIDNENKSCSAHLIAHYDNEEWDIALPEELAKVVGAAKAKSMDYHCRVPYYTKRKDRNKNQNETIKSSK